MNDVVAQFFSYLTGIWRFRWHALAVAWFVCIVGWVVVFRLPDQWAAEARVFVDTQSMLRPLLRGLAVDPDLRTRVNYMTRTLLSRPTLEKVARITDMDLTVESPEDMEELVDRMRTKIEIEGLQQQDLYTISFEASDPHLAKRVVESLLNSFVETVLGDTRQDTDMAQQFLERQVREYEQRLVEAEDKLKEFKRQNVGVMPGSEGDYYQRLETAQQQLRQVQLELREAEIRRDELRRQAEETSPTSDMPMPSFEMAAATVSPASTGAIDRRIEALESQLDSLRVRYTDKHPDVVAVREQLAGLERERAQIVRAYEAQMAQAAAAAAAPADDVNPTYVELKVAVANAEAEVASLEVRAKEYQERMDTLREMMDTVPRVEAELTRLNRDYGIHKAQYEALLERLQQARLSEEAGQSADNVKFKVIDPPRLPLTPVGPNRPLFLSVVLLAGIAAGVGIALALAFLRPVFDSRRGLREATGLPVLGTVTMVWTTGQSWRRRMGAVAFAFAASGLVVVFSAVMAADIVGLNFDLGFGSTL